jgi:hypothetical protein
MNPFNQPVIVFKAFPFPRQSAVGDNPEIFRLQHRRKIFAADSRSLSYQSKVMSFPSVPSIVLGAQGTILSSIGIFALLWPKRYQELQETNDSMMMKVFGQAQPLVLLLLPLR